MQKEKALSVTGHRWQKLPFGANENDARCKALVQLTTDKLTRHFNEGITHVICGMALGFDTIVAEAVIRLQASGYAHVTLEAALICPEHAARWTAQQQQRLSDIIKSCLSPPTIVSPAYREGCEMVRNKYMVDNSRVLLACWNGRPSGTGNTVRYAVEQGVIVDHINPILLGGA